MIFQIEETIFFLSALFLVLLFWVCRKKGLLSFLSLLSAVLLLLFMVIPLIDAGYDPVLVIFLASIPILAIIIYCNEGFSDLSHLSIAATIFCFLLTSCLIFFSVKFANFSGIVSDDASIAGTSGINLQAILSAGVMLSTLGALIEMITTQVATIIGLFNAHPDIDAKDLYKKSYRIGVVHLDAIISTLFLIYAGVSLPLLIIFVGPGVSLSNILGYEPLSTEILRILTGTIGLLISMPISTGLAVWWLKRKK